MEKEAFNKKNKPVTSKLDLNLRFTLKFTSGWFYDA